MTYAFEENHQDITVNVSSSSTLLHNGMEFFERGLGSDIKSLVLEGISRLE